MSGSFPGLERRRDLAMKMGKPVDFMTAMCCQRLEDRGARMQGEAAECERERERQSSNTWQQLGRAQKL